MIIQIDVTLIDYVTGEPNDFRHFDNFEEFENFFKGYYKNIVEIIIYTK